jgi:heterodisulfide reductase subunit A
MAHSKEVKVGVYICHCGGNISDTVDVAKVKEAVAKLDGVKIAETYEYVCSDPGQELIAKGVKEQGLDRVVVAACTPKMHLDTFRKNVESAGLNPYFLEMANIREQCSWVHDDKEAATTKAIDLIRGAVQRAKHLEPLEPKSMPVNKDVLVIGGGVAGIMASNELADKGYKVYLVERKPSIGGHMAQLSKTFPTLDCSQCILTPKMVYASQHPLIEIITMAEPIAIEGTPGNYRVLIRKKPRYVDDGCTACGECTKKCPVKVPSEFEAGLIERKAIYTPFKQAVPRTYVIDEEHCLYFTKGVCRICEKFCKAHVVNFDQKEETIELDVGAIIACTGFEQIDPKQLEEFGYGLHPDIVTNLQFERLMLQGVHKPSNGKVPKKVAFVLCVGSRMMNTERGEEYCCKIGCMAAIKQAMLLQKAVPDAEPWIFYTDIRADGKGYEEFYATAQDHNVKFVRGRVAEVIPAGEQLLVRAEDTLLGEEIEGTFDLVVLSVAIVPHPSTSELARKLGIQLGGDGFYLERHYKLSPVDSQREGVFISGCAVSPKDVRETTLEAMATASRVATFIGKGEILLSPEVAYIIQEKCDACGICVKVCPVAAVQSSASGVIINSVSCIGCGVCVPRCPKQAIDLYNNTETQLMAQIQGVSEGDMHPKIVAFIEGKTAYGSADLAGQTRASYSPNVRIIGVPSIGRVGLSHVMQAFASGADGIVFVEGDDSVFKEDAVREHVMQLKKELGAFGIEPLRLISITTTLPQYDKILNIFETFDKRISRIGPVKTETRRKIREKLATPIETEEQDN